jgi:hypothetical protein
MRVLRRIRTVHSSRGLAGLCRFLGTRIFTRREDLLFDIHLRSAAAPRLEPLDQVVRIGRTNLGSEATAPVEVQVFTGENAEYRDGLRKEDILFAHLDGESRVLTYAFVIFDSAYKRVLGEPVGVPMIGNCYTLPEKRGQRLYPRMLVTVCRALARDGHARAIISCEPDNIASIRGIERAGFARVTHVTSHIGFSKLILRRKAIPF